MKKTILILTAAFLMLSTTTQAQLELWGMTAGEEESYNYGSIFKTDANGNNHSVEYSFPMAEGSHPKHTKLCEANNGKLYGMTCKGGTSGIGVIFEYDPKTGTYTKKFDFDGTNTGDYPLGSLIQASNGKFYGMTYSGGINNYGVIFEYDPAIDTCIKKFDFDGTNNGSNPYGSLMQAGNGKFYGTTYKGGTNNHGVIFEYDLVADTCIKKFDFDYFDSGNNSYGSLMQASNGKLYGMTSNGGDNYGYGTIFEYNTETDTCIKKIDFHDYYTGRNPHGGLMQAGNGKLYGMTEGGGTAGGGILFEYEPGTYTYTVKVNIGGADNGGTPEGSLMQASNGKFYGMTSEGGMNNLGVIFEYDPRTSIYTKKFEFNDTNGSYPKGSLIQASNGKLYGTTFNGGTNNWGVIFEYNPAIGTCIKKFDFDGPGNGSNSYGSLMQAGNGKLYGVTYSGGTNNFGVIFEYDPEIDTCIKKFDFDGTNNGSNPFGSLMQASNGKLYGMTNKGGTNNLGVIFEYDPEIDTCIKKFDFDGTNNGHQPQGSLMQANNGKLYGMTSGGGTNNSGVLFEYDPETGIYTKKVNFDGTNTGSSPQGSLMQASNGKLYGMTSDGGTNYRGVIFEYNPETNTYTKKLDFNDTNGSRPEYTSLIEICPEKLTNQDFTICDGDSILVNGEYLYSTGTYYDTLSTCCGSDSVVVTELIVNPVYNITETAEICNGDVYTWEGSDYTTAGTYTETYTTVNGCDSIRELTLTVFTIDTSVTVNQSTLTANATGTYQWIDCSNNQAISGETNQSFTASETGNYAVEVTQNTCVDTSSCYNIVITSIAENDFGAKITVYPNPASGFVTVELPEYSESYRITLIDMLGRVLLEDDLTGTSKRINLAAYANGVYFLTVEQTQGIASQHSKSFKIIKK